MSIVQYCTSFLYSLFPPRLMLTAPTPRLMLPAPHVSGLICAPQVKVVEHIVVEKYTAIHAALDTLNAFFEEQDAQIERLFQDAHERQRQRIAEAEAHLAAKKRQRELEWQEFLKS